VAPTPAPVVVDQAVDEVARLTAELEAQAQAAVASSARVLELEAEVAALKERLANRLEATSGRVTDGPLTVKDGPPPAERFKMVLVDGERHTDGRSSPPTVFEPYAVDDNDRRPHAFVTQAFGDHLMDLNPGKFVWAD
jgi:hypothetical protein